MGVATNSTHTKVVRTYSICGSGHKQYTLILDMVLATNSTHTTVVDTNSRHGSGHKQYTCPSQSASRTRPHNNAGGGGRVGRRLQTNYGLVHRLLLVLFLCIQAGFFCATRCGSFLLAHRDSNGLIATSVTSCSSSVGDVANVLEGEWR